MSIFHHHQLILAFGVLGNIVSFFVYFAPLPTFIQICKKKSTLGYDSLPYAVALFSAMLWMYYAIVKTNAMLLMSINSFGCVVESIYIIIFLLYASRDTRRKTWKLLASLNVGVFSLILGFTFFVFHGPIRVQVVGWLCVVFSVCVFAAPLNIVFQVVRTKSVEFMPFTLSCFLTLSAVMWFFYGLLLNDLCIALPNVLGFFLGVIQMLLYLVYRNHCKKDQEEVIKEIKLPEHIINLAALGVSEVYPVDTKSNSCASDNNSSDRDSDRDQEINNNHEKIVLAVDEPIQKNVNLHDAPAIIVAVA